MKNLTLYFFEQKLRVSLNFTLSYMNRSSEMIKILLKKRFELNLK